MKLIKRWWSKLFFKKAPIPVNISPEQALLNKIPAVAGEVRAVYRCKSCNQIFGSRYIPYGTGQGAIYQPCLCICVGRPKTELLLTDEDSDGEGNAILV